MDLKDLAAKALEEKHPDPMGEHVLYHSFTRHLVWGELYEQMRFCS